MKVYILREHSGQYEDYYVTVVGVYSTYEKAEIKKNTKIKTNQDIQNKIDESNKIKDEFFDNWYILKEKYLSEGLSIAEINDIYEKLEDDLDCYWSEPEHYWYDINEYELE